MTGEAAHRPPLLAVEELSVSFPALRGGRTRVLDRVSFDVGQSETVGLVGESGSGKTVTALTVMGLGDPRASTEGGRVLLDGQDLLTMPSDQKRDYRGRRVGMIFQTPRASLNPLLKGGEQVARVVAHHYPELSKQGARQRAIELLRSVGIQDAERRFNAYPHQLSGGMAQRVMIAMALAPEPELLIADEPTTGLDVTIQAQIFDLLLELRERLGMSILLITHDLGLVAEACDRVTVVHGGHVVESGSAEAIFAEPKHPYTQRLLGSVLRADRRLEERPERMPNVNERIVYEGTGCRYVAKCPAAFGPCTTVRPALLQIGAPGHRAMCHLYDPAYARELAEKRANAAAG
jgi:oligopeptide/dipeptide ABC transporter ATP-binding protein